MEKGHKLKKELAKANRSLEVYSPRSYRIGQIMAILCGLKILLAFYAYGAEVSVTWATAFGAITCITLPLSIYLIAEHGPKGRR